MKDCLFCNIASGDAECDIVYENDDVLAFRDINPQAPTHILVIPRKHIATVNDIHEGDEILMSKLILAAQDIAGYEGIAEDGYRLVINCNAGAGQAVYHIHMHILGGRQMNWPPG